MGDGWDILSTKAHTTGQLLLQTQVSGTVHPYGVFQLVVRDAMSTVLLTETKSAMDGCLRNGVGQGSSLNTHTERSTTTTSTTLHKRDRLSASGGAIALIVVGLPGVLVEPVVPPRLFV
ncbi:unnamed protein product [Ectocarpus fasciculatus]